MNQPISRLLSVALMLAIFISSLGLVSVRHLNRMAYHDVRQLSGQHDDLSIEWRQMMAEYSTWRLDNNIKAKASAERNMVQPTTGQIKTIHLAGEIGVDR